MFTVFGGNITTDYYGASLSPIKDVLPGAERFSPEPGKSSFAELQGGEKPLERTVLIAPLHGASHRAMSAATSTAREQSWLSQQGAGG